LKKKQFVCAITGDASNMIRTTEKLRMRKIRIMKTVKVLVLTDTDESEKEGFD